MCHITELYKYNTAYRGDSESLDLKPLSQRNNGIKNGKNSRYRFFDDLLRKFQSNEIVINVGV